MIFKNMTTTLCFYRANIKFLLVALGLCCSYITKAQALEDTLITEANQWIPEVKKMTYEYARYHSQFGESGKRRIWKKVNNSYTYTGARYDIPNARLQGGDYTDPFESCLSLPYMKLDFTVSKINIIFSFNEGMQVASSFRGENNDAYAPDLIRYNLGCKGGALTYTGYAICSDGTKLKLKIQSNCNHKIYQTPRTAKIRGYSKTQNKYVDFASPDDNYADPYAPWRQVHKQTLTLNIAQNAKLNGMSKMLFIKRLMTSECLPLSKKKPYYLSDQERKVLFYSLWNTFDFSIEKLEQEIKDSNIVRKGKIFKELESDFVLSKEAFGKEDYETCLNISFKILKDISDARVLKGLMNNKEIKTIVTTNEYIKVQFCESIYRRIAKKKDRDEDDLVKVLEPYMNSINNKDTYKKICLRNAQYAKDKNLKKDEWYFYNKLFALIDRAKITSLPAQELKETEELGCKLMLISADLQKSSLTIWTYWHVLPLTPKSYTTYIKSLSIIEDKKECKKEWKKFCKMYPNEINNNENLKQELIRAKIIKK